MLYLPGKKINSNIYSPSQPSYIRKTYNCDTKYLKNCFYS